MQTGELQIYDSSKIALIPTRSTRKFSAISDEDVQCCLVTESLGCGDALCAVSHAFVIGLHLETNEGLILDVICVICPNCQKVSSPDCIRSVEVRKYHFTSAFSLFWGDVTFTMLVKSINITLSLRSIRHWKWITCIIKGPFVSSWKETCCLSHYQEVYANEICT